VTFLASAVRFTFLGEESVEPEAELISRLRRGDSQALGSAYDLHHEHVRAFAQRLLGDASAAEDLLQDTFVALTRAIRNFRGDSSLRTLLVAISVNHARNHLRSAVRRRSAHERFEAEPRAVGDLERDIERLQTADAITRALDTLPLEQRVAIVLCEVEGRTSAEASQIMGVPEGTVRTRIFHAKRKLKEALVAQGFT
jgi:RNA polymerase sigma-70 factor (ECF subfamily)